jgi:GNAT superfamily N-acetyltransferase
MIHIRPATPDDVSLMLAFIQDLAEYERAPHSVQITEEQLRLDGFGTKCYYKCLIAEAERSPAGFALFFPIYSTWQGRSFHLEDLFVRPAFRGRGIGKMLLRRVAAIAIENGCRRLQWDVLDWNTPAINFYRNLDAVMLDDWRRMRVADEALNALAEGSI